VREPVIHLYQFFERARAGELIGVRCRQCGELAIPPKEFCTTGHQRAWEPVPLSGEGTIASFTVIRVPPREWLAEAPYAVAAVQLREGVSLLGRIVDIPLDELTVGLPVRFRPLEDLRATSVGFGPA
jgi:uncharacterized OB-fold protein